MFGINSAVRRIYFECIERPGPFLVKFEHKISILVKTHDTYRNCVDQDRVKQELRVIAEACKQRNLKTGDYLKLVAKYANEACEGDFRRKKLDAGSLELKKLCKECTVWRSIIPG